jgi:hypothetical protein
MEDEVEDTGYTHEAHEMEAAGTVKYARQAPSHERHELPGRTIDPVELHAGDVHDGRQDERN